jgi:hypothetical protein
MRALIKDKRVRRAVPMDLPLPEIGEAESAASGKILFTI